MWTNPSTQNWSFLGRWKYRGGGRGELWFLCGRIHLPKIGRFGVDGNTEVAAVVSRGFFLILHRIGELIAAEKSGMGGGVFWMLASSFSATGNFV